MALNMSNRISNRPSHEVTLQRKDWSLKSTSGITLEDYNNWLNEIQQGLCPICLTPAPSLVEMAQQKKFWPVDHDHACCDVRSCGRCVRGVLCFMCNAVLTKHWEDPEWRERALAYLEGDKD